MYIQRRSLFKIAAGGALLVTGGSVLTKENGLFWNLWHYLRYRISMSSMPERNPDILSKREEQGTVLHSRSHQQDILILNSTAGCIWEMCDGSHRVEEIIRIISHRFDVANYMCTRDVMLTLMELRQRGVIHS